jgi:transposase
VASGLAQREFALHRGIATQTLSTWLRRFREEGPRGLEPRMRGPKSGRDAGSRLPAGTREAIVQTTPTSAGVGCGTGSGASRAWA